MHMFFFSTTGITHKCYLELRSVMIEEITKEELQQAIHNHLTDCGFSKNDDGFYLAGKLNKQKIRDLHSLNRNEKLHKVQHLIEKRGAELLNHFAAGSEIDPVAIDPELTEVKAETTDSDLFRFATLLWSVPVSHGYGRRMRFLVRDRQNGKLIGIFALGDPVFNLSARDDFIGWTARDRQERLVHVMDAYVIGAVPPYSQLICGKLVAALISCQEVMEVYKRKYIG